MKMVFCWCDRRLVWNGCGTGRRQCDVSAAGRPQTAHLVRHRPRLSKPWHRGHPLSFRTWNGQLRQPIPLVNARAIVAVAPLDGFLHPVTELDTIGRDALESTCTAFGE